MPYPNEFASGESLPGLTSSQSVLEFQGVINIKDANELPNIVAPARDRDHVVRVIAIDGSTVPAAVRNGYPGAEAALMRIAAVVLDLRASKNQNPSEYLDPAKFEIWRNARRWTPCCPAVT